MIIGAVVTQPHTEQPEQQEKDLTLVQVRRMEPLKECVRRALRCYLKNLDGHEVNDLHQMVMGEVELPLVETILDYTNGNQTQAARLLGMSRSTLRKKMADYGIRQDR